MESNMDDAAVAIWLSRARIAIGVVAVAMPRLAVKRLSVDGATAGVAPMLTRMTGARDIALGLGTLVAADRGTPVRGWLEGCALADTADAASALAARKELSRNAFIGSLGLAGCSAVVCGVLSRRLDTPPDPHPGQPEAIITGHHEDG
jgi:hypothetical protein